MKKLILKKEVVSSLNDDQLARLKGGADTTDMPAGSINDTKAVFCSFQDSGCGWGPSYPPTPEHTTPDGGCRIETLLDCTNGPCVTRGCYPYPPTPES